MSVRIITDSAADISPERLSQWGVEALPLKTIIEGVEYLDGVTLSGQEFFEKLIEMDGLPTTSAIAPGEYSKVFHQALQAGDEVVCICLSSKLSACCQAACIATADYPDALLHVVDSLNVSLGEQILVQRAVQLRDSGMSAANIAADLERARTRIRLIGLVGTLEYLKRGGRVSAAVALAGGLLGIKPVIAVQDGEVVVLGQARGSKNGRNLLVEQARKSGGISYDEPYLTAYSGLSDKLLHKYLVDSADHFPIDVDQVPVCHIGSTIGTHVGPGAVAVAFYAREE